MFQAQMESETKSETFFFCIPVFDSGALNIPTSAPFCKQQVREVAVMATEVNDSK